MMCIDLMLFCSVEVTSDRRLAIVKELFRTEDSFLEHLRNIFDVYMEPLRFVAVHVLYVSELLLLANIQVHALLCVHVHTCGISGFKRWCVYIYI